MTRKSIVLQKGVSIGSLAMFCAACCIVSTAFRGPVCFGLCLFGFFIAAFLCVLRYYLSHEQQMSASYRAHLRGWRVVMFDVVVKAVPICAILSVVCATGAWLY